MTPPHQTSTTRAITVASYNIHKAIGLDRRRDPERVLTVLREVDADIVALQEADRRFGERVSAIPPELIEEYSAYIPVRIGTAKGVPGPRAGSIGWHGNAILVRRGITVVSARPVRLPTLEPRGAVLAQLLVDGVAVSVVGMHLDLSGIRRRQQMRVIFAEIAARPAGQHSVLLGDLNEWAQHGGCLRDIADDHRMLSPGRSFHTRRPVAQLDRIIISDGLTLQACGVHHSVAASRASDHLPVWARLSF
jgi:endonuclease/exonuclease/phosphatase family metal-dependent hydrolase